MAQHPTAPSAPPLLPGRFGNIRFDMIAGFLVFLIAMPLCLGIAKASNFPPIAGLWTAVIGGVLCTLISGSQLTIKGPAAGMIVIVAGAVTGLGADAYPSIPDGERSALVAEGKTEDDLKRILDERQIQKGYPLSLGIGVAAGLIQVLFGLVKAGKLGEIVPLTPVHGMLAAIGITIMAKQFYPMMGMSAPTGVELIPFLEHDTPIQTIAAIPGSLGNINWTVASIGLVGLAILIAFPFLKSRVKFLAGVPGQLIVLFAAIPLALALALEKKFLVNIPNVIPDVFENFRVAFMVPDFAGLPTGTGVKFVILFALVGSIESLLSAQAIDLIDPWKRKTDMNRDLLAVGICNTLCAAVGALPMISEIVRSKANIDNKARTKMSNLFPGLFLLAFVLAVPGLIRMIPLAALGAMLVFTGFRLASPKEFIHTFKIGAEQLIVFITTIVVTLSTDLLIGVFSGIALKMLFHLYNGAPIVAMLRPSVSTRSEGATAVVVVQRAAVFSNWLGVKNAIRTAVLSHDEVVVDLTHTRLVDHSVIEKLHELENEFASNGKHLRLVGLERHIALSAHPLAARRCPKQVAADAL